MSVAKSPHQPMPGPSHSFRNIAQATPPPDDDQTTKVGSDSDLTNKKASIPRANSVESDLTELASEASEPGEPENEKTAQGEEAPEDEDKEKDNSTPAPWSIYVGRRDDATAQVSRLR